MARTTALAVLLSLCTVAAAQTQDDAVFLHHSCGSNWLNGGLHAALLSKDYVDERNDITYGTAMSPDAGRPSSLGSVPGDRTDMNHWILWFNDYLEGVKQQGCADGENKIVMFKSCYPLSNISSDGSLPGDPFSGSRTVTNYQAVYRHAAGSGSTYSSGGYTYKPLEDIFAENPDTLFIPVTAPALHYAPSDATSDAAGHRARVFNNWLKGDWLASYNAAHPGLNNVMVFDWFDVLAYPDDHTTHPNRLRSEYGGASGDSHPNSLACANTTEIFATGTANLLDPAWESFSGPPPIPGDANRDGVVSDADYTIWADNYGQTGANWDMGDFNGSGSITEADYTIWADNYGSVAPTGVPEPFTVAILGVGALLLRKRR
jgi:hypothetical protein